jgi:structural maintenance of chromosome 4
VPRLFDLIKPKEPKFAPAFFKRVGNALVADDLDQANRIAFGGQRRWRVVTLSGQLIDIVGYYVWRWKSRSESSKLAPEAVGPQTLKAYEKESEEATQQLEEALQSLRHVEAEVENLGKSGPQIDIAMEKINLDIQGCSRRIAEAEKGREVK